MPPDAHTRLSDGQKTRPQKVNLNAWPGRSLREFRRGIKLVEVLRKGWEKRKSRRTLYSVREAEIPGVFRSQICVGVKEIGGMGSVDSKWFQFHPGEHGRRQKECFCFNDVSLFISDVFTVQQDF